VSTIAPLRDISAYPRVYRASGGWLIALIICGVVLALGGIIGTWFIATEPLRSAQSRFWLVGLCLVFAALGVYCLLSTFRSRVVLFADRIEVEELTHTITLSRDEIRGWRSIPTSPPGFLLLPKDASRGKIKVAQLFPLDPEFAEWMYTLPCLDRDDARTSKAEIRNDARFGETPGERMQTLAKGKRLAKVLTIVSFLAVLWGFLFPVPYVLAILILMVLPWIALGLVKTSGGLFRVDTNRNDAHPSVGVPFLFPGLVLMLRSASDFNVLQSSAVALLSVGIGGLLCLSVFAVDPTTRRNRIIGIPLVAFSLIYGYGVAIEANVLFDRSRAVGYTATLEGKHIVNGKRTTYELDLGPWGPITKSNKLNVGRETYDAIQRGDAVYLTLRKGALGVSWYFLRAVGPADQPRAIQSPQ